MSLTKDEKAHLVSILKDRHAELLSAVREHVGQLREDDFPLVAGAVGDLADQALADLVRDSDNAAVGRDVREIREIEDALNRMDGGEYGRCANCGVDIAYERLMVNPAATRCVRCQDLYEHTHAQPNEPSL